MAKAADPRKGGEVLRYKVKGHSEILRRNARLRMTAQTNVSLSEAVCCSQTFSFHCNLKAIRPYPH
jgi:hypothetical protein